VRAFEAALSLFNGDIKDDVNGWGVMDRKG
jgi:hypothetical protein